MIFSKFLAGLAALAATANAGLNTCGDVKALYQGENCCNQLDGKLIDASDKIVQGFPAGTGIMHASVDQNGEYVYLSTMSSKTHAPSLLVFKLEEITFGDASPVPITFVKEILLGPAGQLSAYPNTEELVPLCNSADDLEAGDGPVDGGLLGLACAETGVTGSWVFGKDPSRGTGGYYYTQGHGPTWSRDYSFAHFTIWQDNRFIAIDHATQNILKPNLGYDYADGTKTQNAHGLFFRPDGEKALDTGYTFGNNQLDLYDAVLEDGKYTGKVTHAKTIKLKDGVNGTEYGAFTHFVTWLDDRWAFTGTMQTGRTSLDCINNDADPVECVYYNVIPPSVFLIDTEAAEGEESSVIVNNRISCATDAYKCIDKPISDIKVVANGNGETLLFVGQEDSLSNTDDRSEGIILVFKVTGGAGVTPGLEFLRRIADTTSTDEGGNPVVPDDVNGYSLPRGTDGAGVLVNVLEGTDTVVAGSFSDPKTYNYTLGIHGFNVCADGSCIYAIDYRAGVLHKISTKNANGHGVADTDIKVVASYVERDAAHGAMVVGEFKSSSVPLGNAGVVNENLLVGTEFQDGHLFFINTDNEADPAKLVNIKNGGDVTYV